MAKIWTHERKKKLMQLRASLRSKKIPREQWVWIANQLGVGVRGAENAYYKFRHEFPMISESPYPKWDSPLEMEGDAVILPDPEIPFHHAEFLNNILDLAFKWDIEQAIIAGDALHFNSLSAWEASWINSPAIADGDANRLHNFVMSLSSRKRAEGLKLMTEIEVGNERSAPNVSDELAIARKTLHRLEELFDRIDFVLGNHEGRFIRALDCVVSPDELARLLELGEKWRIAPYYYSLLHTRQGTYRISHPKSSAKYSAEKMASKYQQHFLMAHSHKLRINWDVSGKFWACHIGCCVDEERLAYAAQRDSPGEAHKLGAAIVRDGFLWMLHEHVDWDALGKIK